MKRLSLYLFLILFTLQTPSQADDIRDFQIEGMSIGDSLLDYFDKSYIDKKGKHLYPNKDFKGSKFTSNKFQIYDSIFIHYLSNDGKYVIYSISANIYYPNKISDCLKKRKEINKNIKSLFDNPEEEDWGKRVLKNIDKSLQTYAYQNIYWLNEGNIIVSCRDYGKIKESEGLRDYLSIMIDSNYFADWLNNKAWN